MPYGASALLVKAGWVNKRSKLELVDNTAKMDNLRKTIDRYQLDRHSDERPVFEDPRQHKDRRVAHHPDLIPEGGCRRKMERRSDRINLGCWWMKRKYAAGGTLR